MTSWNGNIAQPHIPIDLGDSTSTNIRNLTNRVNYAYLWEMNTSTYGPQTSTQPSDTHSKALTGDKLNSFGDIYYNQIHISPNIFLFGNILSPIKTEYYVWNAYLDESKELTEITSVNGSQVEITGQTAPYTFLPLQELKYNVDVSLAGQAKFVTTYTYCFGETACNDVVFSGERITLIQNKPQKGIKETITFNTSVNTSIIGNEERFKVNKEGIQSLDYKYISNDSNKNGLLSNALIGIHYLTFGCPVWTETQQISTNIEVGTTTINVNTRYMSMFDKCSVMIYKDYNTYEVVEVTNITDTSFDITLGTVNAYTAPFDVMPVRFSWVEDNTEQKRYSGDNVNSFDFNFISDDNPEVAGYSSSVSYAGLPVILEQPFYSGSDQTVKYYSNTVQETNATGYIRQFTKWAKPKPQRAISYNLISQEQIHEFKQFLYYLSGKLNTFYIPYYSQSIRIYSTLTAGDTNLDIHNIGFAKYTFGKNLRNNIVIFDQSGNYYFKSITGAADIDNNSENITLDSGLAFDLTSAQHTIFFLTRVRSNSDTFELNYERIGQAEITLDLIEV